MSSRHFKMNNTEKQSLVDKIESKEEDTELVYAISVNCVPRNNAEFEVENIEEYSKFFEANNEERMKILSKQSKVFKFPNDFEEIMLKAYHHRMLNKIKNDKELNGYWKYEQNIKTVQQSTSALMAEKLFRTIKNRRAVENNKLPSEGIVCSKKFAKYLKSTEFTNFLNSITYKPPTTRVMISKNITFNIFNWLPVFSDLNGEVQKENNKVKLVKPESLTYYYGERNLAYAGKNEQLGKAALLSCQKENKIVCDCCSRDPIVKCYENEDCPCYQMNLKFQKIRDETWKREKNPMKAPQTTINSFDQILFAAQEGVFFENAAFACCSECSCKGKCTNNPLLLVEKNVFPLEIYRSNEITGFGLRTYATIPAGTPVMEFAGEIVNEKNFKKENIDYAYRVLHTSKKEPVLWETILHGQNWSEEYLELLKSFSKQVFYLDPKVYGNVGRTALHSCTPNTDLIRVYQKSVSPLHVRLIFVTLENVFAGTPLTLDYGCNYVQEQFGSNCLCNSFACLRNASSPSVNFNEGQLAKCFEKAEKHQRKLFEELIAEKENKKRVLEGSNDKNGPGAKKIRSD